jgi:micrococcal nuclease
MRQLGATVVDSSFTHLSMPASVNSHLTCPSTGGGTLGSSVALPLLILAWIFVASEVSWLEKALASEYPAKVIAVASGDVFTVLHQNRTEKIRLNGVDCPESDQPFGKRAKQFTSNLALGKTVTVVSVGQDRQGRVVADVFLADGQLLSYLLVKEGLAWWYRQYALDNTTLEQLEREARKAKKGLWADPNAVAPWQWRRGKRHVR